MLLDEASLLACAAYVDLNPIAGSDGPVAPDERLHWGLERIDDLAQRPERSGMSTHQRERRGGGHSGWMSPVEIDEARDAVGPCACSMNWRSRDEEFLSLERYLELLDWTGSQLRAGKVGVIPSHLPPILSRIDLDNRVWYDLVSGFGRIFKRAAGTPQSLASEAVRRGQHWLCDPENRLGMLLVQTVGVDECSEATIGVTAAPGVC